ncbi:MAG: hypothetical protein IJX80_02375 [Clostridia bacterium]|nr:hypothetical protein [Clostridia bacterium]
MFQPSPKTISMLEDIERRIDPEVEEDFSAQWRRFLYGEFDGDVFAPRRKRLSEPGIQYPKIYINDAIEDYDLMLQSELATLSHVLNNFSRTLGVWVGGYGTGLLSSVLGAEIFVVPRDLNTPPTTRTLGNTERLREMVERGIPDLENGFGKRTFECGEIFADVFSKYPKIAKYVNVYHPDLQGPLDIAELLWGGDMFYAMYDEPELVHGVLSLITETFTAFLRRWQKIFPCTSDINCYKFYHYRGTILLRCDSAMNLSPELYREYAVPYDTRLYERFGGGAMHFCGKGDHYIEMLSQVPGLTGVNLAQPEYNDMETIYRHTVDKGIKILMLNRNQALNDKDRAGGYHHCMSTWA